MPCFRVPDCSKPASPLLHGECQRSVYLVASLYLPPPPRLTFPCSSGVFGDREHQLANAVQQIPPKLSVRAQPFIMLTSSGQDFRKPSSSHVGSLHGGSQVLARAGVIGRRHQPGDPRLRRPTHAAARWAGRGAPPPPTALRGQRLQEGQMEESASLLVR